MLLRIAARRQTDGVTRLRSGVDVDVVPSLGGHLGELAIQQPHPWGMDEEGADSRRDGPQGDLEGFELEVVGGIDEAGDEQDRPDGDEDVLTEEQSNGVRRGGIGAQFLPHLAGVARVIASGGSLSHRHDEGTHRLGGSADG